MNEIVVLRLQVLGGYGISEGGQKLRCLSAKSLTFFERVNSGAKQRFQKEEVM